MERYSFEGPYAYRWVDDVPVERIHLRNGERREIRIGAPSAAAPPPAASASTGAGAEAEGVRALMAAWN
jgi:hypothetical protein